MLLPLECRRPQRWPETGRACGGGVGSWEEAGGGGNARVFCGRVVSEDESASGERGGSRGPTVGLSVRGRLRLNVSVRGRLRLNEPW